MASPLPRECSTSELQQHRGGFSGIGAGNASPLAQEIGPGNVKIPFTLARFQSDNRSAGLLSLDLTYLAG